MTQIKGTTENSIPRDPTTIPSDNKKEPSQPPTNAQNVSNQILSEQEEVESEKKITPNRVQTVPSTPSHPSAARAKIEQIMQDIESNPGRGNDPFVLRDLKKNIDAYENEIKESTLGWIQHLVAKILTTFKMKESLTKKAIDFYESKLDQNDNLKIFKKSLENPEKSYQVTGLYYKDSKTNDEIIYSGKIINGQFLQGTLINRTRDIMYTGSFKNNDFDGYGELQDPTASVYKGEFKNGQAHGKGQKNYFDGSVYDGEFKNGQPNGEGKIEYLDKAPVNGIFIDGSPIYNNTPLNTLTNKNTLKDDKNGYGIIIDMNGTYQGTFVNGELNGIGKITTLEGDICEGIFENNTLISGTISYADGNFLRGTFENGKPKDGILTYYDKVIYEGHFKDYAPDGKGKMTFPDGEVFDGEFKDGEFISGIKTDENGKKTTYENDEPV